MARGSIVKRKSGNYAIVYCVDGKQKWETVGPSRREAERALTARKREVDTGAWREPVERDTRVLLRRAGSRTATPLGCERGRTRLSPSTFAEYRRALSPTSSPGSASGRSRLSEPRTWTGSSRARGRREGARDGSERRRPSTQDARRRRAAGKLATNPAVRADLPPAQDFAGKEIPGAHTDAIREALLSWRRLIRSETSRISFPSVSSM